MPLGTWYTDLVVGGRQGRESIRQAPLEKEGGGNTRNLAVASGSLIHLELLQATSGGHIWNHDATGLFRAARRREREGGTVLTSGQTTQDFAVGELSRETNFSHHAAHLSVSQLSDRIHGNTEEP